MDWTLAQSQGYLKLEGLLFEESLVRLKGVLGLFLVENVQERERKEKTVR